MPNGDRGPFGGPSKSRRPEVAKVEALSLPHEPGRPTFVVAILPFDDSASGLTSGGGATPSAPAAVGTPVGIITGGLTGGRVNTTFPQAPTSVGPVGMGIAAQLRTALARWGNISIIEPAALTRQADGTYTCKMSEREVGPFIISGTVTEFNETADLTQQMKGGSLGELGTVLGIAGALAHGPIGRESASQSTTAFALPPGATVNLKMRAVNETGPGPFGEPVQASVT